MDQSVDLKTVFDFSGDINFLSSPFEESLFGFTAACPLKDSEMFLSEQRTRKCSISDIIDVINDEQNQLKHNYSACQKDEGYVSSHSSSSLSDEAFGSTHILSTNERSFDDDDLEPNGHTQHDILNTPVTECHTYDNSIEDFSTKNDRVSVDNDIVMVIVKHNNRTQIINTTKDRLQNILGNCSAVPTKSKLFINEEEDEREKPEEDLKLKSSAVEDEGKRRGRKRIYFSNTDTEREDSKRVRNNEACRKFRKERTTKTKTLFEQESVLLQRNLNLKEQVAALQRQLVYIKERLNMSK